MERVTGVGPVSRPWQGRIIAAIRYPLTHGFSGQRPLKSSRRLQAFYIFLFSFSRECALERNPCLPAGREPHLVMLALNSWCARVESNHDFRIRNPMSYPLNDERINDEGV